MSRFTNRVTKEAIALMALVATVACETSPTAITVPSELSSAPLEIARQANLSDRFVANQYIVVFRDGGIDIDAESRVLIAKTKGRITRSFKSSLRGFSGTMTAAEAAVIAADPAVAYVEQDQIVSADWGEIAGKTSTTLTEKTGSSKKGRGKHATDSALSPESTTPLGEQTDARWNLDRIDQASLPLDHTYTYYGTGSEVNVYIVDTGIRTTHAEFEGRATGDFTAIDDGYGATGCHWHGTHVAGTVGGRSVGVAKKALLHSVRVLDCNGSGTWSQIIAGIDWVTANRVLPAVMNISISGGYSQAVNDAVDRAVASGVTVVVAAGNNASDACGYSPASAGAAVTVGGTTSGDRMVSTSNYGPCLDMLAPGENVVSAWNSSDTWLDVATGTSMAAPHVAGAAALFLEKNPQAGPAEVMTAVSRVGTSGAIKSISSNTLNLLVRVQ